MPFRTGPASCAAPPRDPVARPVEAASGWDAEAATRLRSGRRGSQFGPRASPWERVTARGRAPDLRVADGPGGTLGHRQARLRLGGAHPCRMLPLRAWCLRGARRRRSRRPRCGRRAEPSSRAPTSPGHPARWPPAGRRAAPPRRVARPRGRPGAATVLVRADLAADMGSEGFHPAPRPIRRAVGVGRAGGGKGGAAVPGRSGGAGCDVVRAAAGLVTAD